MRNAYRWMWVIGTIISLASILLLHQRTGSIVNTSDELITSTQDLLRILQSVRDSASAQAATQQIREKYDRVYALSQDLISTAKSADRFGGITKEGKEKLQDHIAKYVSAMQQCNREIERIKGLRGLSVDFWSTLRGQLAKTVLVWVEVSAGQLPAPTVQFLRSTAELIEEYGAQRVVLIDLSGTSPEKTAEIAAQLQAKMGSAAKTVKDNSDGDSAVLIGPVDDFEKFVAGIDFGTVTDQDAGQRMIVVRTGAAPVEAQASSNPPEKPSFEAAPNPRPQSFANAGAPEKPAEPVDPVALARKRAEMEQKRLEEQGFPNPSDPEYHKKLCDLMVDSKNCTLNDDAVDALLHIQPQDVQDKAVRQQIARNFRELAMKNSAGNDHGKAIRGLVLYGGKYSVPLLIEIMEEQSLSVPDELFDGLASFPDPRGAEAVCQRLGNFFNHRKAVRALRTMGAVAEDALLKAAPSDDAQVSLAAVKLLEEVGTKKSLPLLGKAAKSRNQDVRTAAKDAAKAIVERSKTTAPPAQ